MKLSIFSTLVSMLCLSAVIYMHNTAVNKTKLVYEICQESRMSETITESTCGELQDRFGLSFTCAERNSLPSNKCWVEKI